MAKRKKLWPDDQAERPFAKDGGWGEQSRMFDNRVLLIPKQRGDLQSATYSPAAQLRTALMPHRKNLELLRPVKNATNVLQRIGFEDIRELREGPRLMRMAGAFAPLEQL